MDEEDLAMIYVVCFYWQGDRWQQRGYRQPNGHINHQSLFINRAGVVSDKLPARYINNLYRGVERFAEEEFRFVCFTNEIMQLDSNIEVRRFPIVTHHGVLPRLYMFSEASGLFGHQVLCLDIDIVIVGSLKDIMAYRGDFCTRLKFRPSREVKLDGDVMSFKACKETEDKFWIPFVQNINEVTKRTRGRERYWVREVTRNKADVWDSLTPGQIVSYKNHVKRSRKIPTNARIVSCHGVPRPHEIRDNWIKDYWK